MVEVLQYLRVSQGVLKRVEASTTPSSRSAAARFGWRRGSRPAGGREERNGPDAEGRANSHRECHTPRAAGGGRPKERREPPVGRKIAAETGHTMRTW